MRVVDQILREQRERDRRYETAKAAIAELSSEQQQRLLTELIQAVESGGQPRKRAGAVPKRGRRSAPESSPVHVVSESVKANANASGEPSAYVDKAEAYVAQHEGPTTAEVATGIGQSRQAADGTLRHLARSRGTVERREGRWWPVTAGAKAPIKPPHLATKLTNRSAIVTVLGKGKALGTGAIYDAVVQMIPTAQRSSVASEINRMKGDSLLVERGNAGRGPAYALANGGTHTADVN